MGKWSEQKAIIDAVAHEINSNLVPQIRQQQAELTLRYKEAQEQLVKTLTALYAATSKIENASAHLVMKEVEETDAEGTGIIGRRRSSTNMVQGEAEVAKVEKKVKAAIAPPVKEPGKRYCSKCGFAGHRAKNCPN